MSQTHILIVDDHEDIYENISRKIAERFPDFKISIKDNCDAAFDVIKYSKQNTPVTILILDLTFNGQHPNALLPNGTSLLRTLKENKIQINTIIYSSHDDLQHISPVIKNFEPASYVIKSNSSSKELLFAIEQCLVGKTYYSHTVHELQLKRVKYEFSIDEIDEQIIKHLPNKDSIKDWEGVVLKDNIPLSYKTISKRIKNLITQFDVDNEKQLLLKLQKLAIL